MDMGCGGSGGCRDGQKRTAARENEEDERTAGAQTTSIVIWVLGNVFPIFVLSTNNSFSFFRMLSTCCHPHPVLTRRRPRMRATARGVGLLLCHLEQGAPLPLPGPPHLLRWAHDDTAASNCLRGGGSPRLLRDPNHAREHLLVGWIAPSPDDHDAAPVLEGARNCGSS
jgi:hypothetical protein